MIKKTQRNTTETVSFCPHPTFFPVLDERKEEEEK
jgi:hypothetical protein